MSELARSMPGYTSHKVFVAEDGAQICQVVRDFGFKAE